MPTSLREPAKLNPQSRCHTNHLLIFPPSRVFATKKRGRELVVVMMVVMALLLLL
jgi:hypothetical protein